MDMGPSRSPNPIPGSGIRPMSLLLIIVIMCGIPDTLRVGRCDTTVYIPGSLSLFVDPDDGSYTRPATDTNKNVLRLSHPDTSYTIQATFQAASSTLTLSDAVYGYSWGCNGASVCTSSASVNTPIACAARIQQIAPDVTHQGAYNYVVTCVTQPNKWNGRNLPLVITLGNTTVATQEFFEYAPPSAVDSWVSLASVIISDAYGNPMSCGSGSSSAAPYSALVYPAYQNKSIVLPRDRFLWLNMTSVSGGVPSASSLGVGSLGYPYYSYPLRNIFINWMYLALAPINASVDSAGNVATVDISSVIPQHLFLSPIVRPTIQVYQGSSCANGQLNVTYTPVTGEFLFPSLTYTYIQPLIDKYGFFFKLVMIAGNPNVFENVNTLWSVPTPWTISYQPPPRVDYAVGCSTTAAQNTRQVTGCDTAGGQTVTIYGAYLFNSSSVSLSMSVGGVAVVVTWVSSVGTSVSFVTPVMTGTDRVINITTHDQSTPFTDPVTSISYAPPTITNIQSAACTPDPTKPGCAVPAPTGTGTCTALVNCVRRANQTYLLTVQGLNFGSGAVSESATVFVGAKPCANVQHDPVTPHIKLTCVLPDGSDIHLPLFVIQSDAASSTSALVNYAQCQPGTRNNGLDCETCIDGTFTTVQAQPNCVQATPGTYAWSDHTNSQPCGVGTYQNSTGATACQPCPLGRWTNSTGQVICQPADVGYTATLPTRQDPCPPGTAQPKPGQSTCLPCTNGTYTSTPAQIKCLDADQGYYSENCTRQTACPAGTFQNLPAQSTCHPCPSGWYSNSSGQVICRAAEQGRYVDPHDATQSAPCADGTYQPSTGMTSCPTCPAGTSSQGSGQVECKEVQPGNYVDHNQQAYPCAAGSYTDQPGQSQCRLCAVGSYTGATGQLTCQSADVGSYVDVPGSTSSTPCPAGQYQPSSNASTCLQCPVGSAQPQTAQTLCQPCDQGRYADVSGLSACLSCPIGTFSDNKGSSVCQACAAGTFQDATGQTVCTQCDAGGRQQYVVTDRMTGLHSCQACPTGARCSGGLVIGTADVWLAAQADTSVQAFTCQSGRCEACQVASDSSGTTTNVTTSTSTSTNSTLVASIRQCCSANREPADTNPLCGRCISGYVEWGGSCVACSSTNVGVVAALVMTSWLYVAAFIVVCQSNDGLVKIFMYFAATAYALIGPDVTSLSWISFFQFGIFSSGSSGSSTCVAAISPSNKLLLSLMSPVIAVAQLLLIMLGHIIYRAWLHARQLRMGRPHIKWRWGLQPFARALIGLLLYSFTQTTTTVAKFLACQRVTYDGKSDSYIMTSPSTSCTSSEYRTLLPVFIVVGVVLVIVLPLLVFAAVYVYRAQLHEPGVMSLLGVVYSAYRPRPRGLHAWYEIVVLLRRALVVSILVSLGNDAQMYTIVSLINISILAVHVAVRPFTSTTHNVMESVSLLCLTGISVMLVPNSNSNVSMSAGYWVLLWILVMGPLVSLLAMILYQTLQARQQPSSGTSIVPSRFHKQGTGTQAQAQAQAQQAAPDHSSSQVSAPLALGRHPHPHPHPPSAPAGNSTPTVESRAQPSSSPSSSRSEAHTVTGPPTHTETGPVAILSPHPFGTSP